MCMAIFRLEQLDQFEHGTLRRTPDLTQQEYVAKINELSQQLIEAWDQDQRVMSIRIVIQCAKMLSDTDVVAFYPSKFILITDIL